MAEYTVEWIIQVEASSVVDAAREALRVHRDRESIATVFTVTDDRGRKTLVDVKEKIG